MQLTVYIDDHRHAEALVDCAQVGIEGDPRAGHAAAATVAVNAVRRALYRASTDWHAVVDEHMESDAAERDVLIVFREPAGSRATPPSEEQAVGEVVELSDHSVRLRPADAYRTALRPTLVPLRWIVSFEVAAS